MHGVGVAQCGLFDPKGDKEGLCVGAEIAAVRDWYILRAPI